MAHWGAGTIATALTVILFSSVAVLDGIERWAHESIADVSRTEAVQMSPLEKTTDGETGTVLAKLPQPQDRLFRVPLVLECALVRQRLLPQEGRPIGAVPS